LSDSEFTVDGYWPHDHDLFAPLQDGRHDPLLVVETLRQSGILIAHTEFGVPLGYHFVMSNLRFSCDRRNMQVTPGNGHVEVRVTCSGVRVRASQLSAMKVEVDIRRAGQQIAVASGDVTCTSPQVYRRLRGARLDSIGAPIRLLRPLPPELAGRTDAADVVLSPTPQQNTWRLRVDTGHRSFFQRPNDHVPGMLLLEAARQAACAGAAPDPFVPVSGTISFSKYAEFAEPCWIQATTLESPSAGAREVEVIAHQGDELVLCARLTGNAATDHADAFA
jgi:hypothetical protein